MFGRLVDMATRTLIIDLSKGTGGEPMYGMVTVQRTRATSEGTFEVLPWETKLKLFNGKATITEAVTDGSGPFYDTAYIIRVQNGYCAPRWGFMVALPDGTTPISTGDMPKVNPITGEGIYMDAQEWNALYGTLPDRVSGLEVRASATETRLDVLDGQGQRGYTVKEIAGRTVTVWDYLNNREQLIYGDTGWRNISSLVTGLISGAIWIRRSGNIVTIRFDDLIVADQGTTWVYWVGLLNSGFRYDGLGYAYLPLSPNSTLDSTGGARIDRFGNLYIYNMSGGKRARGLATWPTADPWPTTLPGVAV